MYVPGSGGAFIGSLFHYYLKLIPLNSLVLSTRGHAPEFLNNNRVCITHKNTSENADRSKNKFIVIGIDFNNIREQRHIITMNYYKFFKCIVDDVSNHDTLRKNFQVVPEWINTILSLSEPERSNYYINDSLKLFNTDTYGIQQAVNNFDLVIPFNTMIKEPAALNQLIAKFLDVEVDPAVEPYINDWQILANKYLGE
jgi:hypothetical protein